MVVCIFWWTVHLPGSAPYAISNPVGVQHEGSPTHQHGHSAVASSPAWEGSPQGIAYSEFNHHLAGLFVLLIGLSELVPALALHFLAWTRVLLPLSLLAAGMFLLIWSDHDAWPVGSLTIAQTLSGDDPEMLQHKIYGLLAVAVGLIELLRRFGPKRPAIWTLPLPLFAIVGGFMLFGHAHGEHPAAYKIHIHHTVMGLLAITAGSSKLISEWRKADGSTRSVRSLVSGSVASWELPWALLILAIGIQLLIYAE
jgi:hypothetical protein